MKECADQQELDHEVEPKQEQDDCCERAVDHRVATEVIDVERIEE